MRGEGSKRVAEGKRREVRHRGRIWMNDVGKGAKMTNFLNVTSRALTSLYVTYSEQVKMPNERRGLQPKMRGGAMIASKIRNNFSYTSLLFLWSHWSLNTSHPRPSHLTMGCCRYLDTCRQNYYILSSWCPWQRIYDPSNFPRRGCGVTLFKQVLPLDPLYAPNIQWRPVFQEVDSVQWTTRSFFILLSVVRFEMGAEMST